LKFFSEIGQMGSKFSLNLTLEANMTKISLVTGPARSGKSEWAEALASQSQKTVVYVATAQMNPSDPEWQARILRHQARRPSSWKTLAVPIALAHTIQSAIATECLLIDSLGTWLANLIEQDEATWQQESQQLLTSLQQSQAEIIIVAEETGWGVVPAYPLGRSFRDRLGTLTRDVGAIAQVVYLVTAGHALNLTALGQKLPPAPTIEPAIEPDIEP
jgi:adenosylcobinamide kinase/adenosylcobinamide-phosphate guanylyltransferase